MGVYVTEGNFGGTQSGNIYFNRTQGGFKR